MENYKNILIEENRKVKFKNYKEKQKYFKNKKTIKSIYDSGKRTNVKGEVRIKGIPYVKEKW